MRMNLLQNGFIYAISLFILMVLPALCLPVYPKDISSENLKHIMPISRTIVIGRVLDEERSMIDFNEYTDTNDQKVRTGAEFSPYFQSVYNIDIEEVIVDQQKIIQTGILELYSYPNATMSEREMVNRTMGRSVGITTPGWPSLREGVRYIIFIADINKNMRFNNGKSHIVNKVAIDNDAHSLDDIGITITPNMFEIAEGINEMPLHESLNALYLHYLGEYETEMGGILRGEIETGRPMDTVGKK